MSNAGRSFACWIVLSAGLAAGLVISPAMAWPGGPDDGTKTAATASMVYTGKQHSKAASIEELAEDIEAYRQHITTLSNPFMEGRAPGTHGNRVAADYIEFNVKNLGLLPAFPTETKDAAGNVTGKTERNSYRQVFTAPFSPRPGDSIKLTEQNLSYDASGKKVDLTPGKDYNVIGYSGSGEVNGPVVFVGYATENEDKHFTALPEGTKLDGKIAMVFRFEPMTAEGKSKWTDVRWSLAANMDGKLARLEKAGAAAVILVGPPGADDERNAKLEDMGLGAGGRGALKVPVVMMSMDAADAFVKSADAQHRSLMDLRKLADEAPQAIDLAGAPVSVKTKLERVPLLTDNVGAVLPGRGTLAGEYIVIGSHYDHVGYGYIGAQPENRGKLHPGADDNASGSSGNLLIAKKIAEAYKTLPENANARSVLFLWFSAEESGLVGSAFYTKNPIVPIEKHALMLNMDMIGRLRDGKFEVGGIGTADGLDTWTQPYWDEFGMKVKATRLGAPNSDHFSFQLKKVPNLFFFTGLHKEYHKPADVIGTINVEGGARVVDLVYRIAMDAAQRPEPFVYKDSSRDEDPGEKKDGEKKEGDNKDQQQIGSVSGSGVRFGIAPGDYSGEEKGVLIGEVFADTPAAKGGLKEGDLMTKWGDTVLTGVEGWMPLLQAAKPGDVVKITYQRKVDGKMQELTTDVTLVARSRKPTQ
ncbi:MAG: M28 family peptidase [Planctomycetes bacterium]|nr:M28 family peptidase [Planctomycetota bacterium]